MRQILFLQKDTFRFGDLFYVLVYFGLHGLAIYYFLTAGGNPGFADAESEQSSEMLQI